MNRKEVYTYFLVFIFVFSFALAFQIAAGPGPGGDELIGCCYEPCNGVGLGDYGHWDGDPQTGQFCNCVSVPQWFKCTHECNECAE